LSFKVAKTDIIEHNRGKVHCHVEIFQGGYTYDLKEINRLDVCSYSTITKLYSKAFEDSSGALDLANAPKMRPMTEHMNLV
jgi:hypothetical protein